MAASAPPNPYAVSSDTPLTLKRMKTFPAGNSDSLRQNMAHDLQESVPSVPLDFFFNRGILPDLRDGLDVQAVLKTLKSEGRLDSKGRWKAFTSTAQIQHGGHEDEVYGALADVIEAIRAASGLAASEACLNFKFDPKRAPTSTTRDNDTKPDAVAMLPRATVANMVLGPPVPVGGLSASQKQRSNLKKGKSKAKKGKSKAKGTRKSKAAADDVPQWIDVAVPAEFKKAQTPGDILDNTTKVLWSMTHIMREDVRRRFVIGFTIESWFVTLWFASRSEVLASKQFTMHSAKFVDFILRVLYATPQELGWDTTIRRISPPTQHMPIQYDIDVKDRTFRTTRTISNIGAEALRGRGTRVWEVREVIKATGEPFGPPMVLKDCWVDAVRTPEAEILDAMHSAAREVDARKTAEEEKKGKNKGKKRLKGNGKGDDNDNDDGDNNNNNDGVDDDDDDSAQVLADTLPTVFIHGDIPVDGQRDDTHVVMRRNKTLDPSEVKQVLVPADPREHSKIVSHNFPPIGQFVMPQAEQKKNLLQYGAKVHHRTVFHEVGTALRDVTSLAQVFKCLVDVVDCLQALHEAKWVHRDISIGNILLVGKLGVVTDVEYAKTQDTTSTHKDIRTGTPFFMSIEVEDSKYLHLGEPENPVIIPTPATAPSVAKHNRAADRQARKRGANLPASPSLLGKRVAGNVFGPKPSPPPPSRPSPPFRHNPLHDLESLFWVALWMLVCSKFVNPDQKVYPQEKWDAYMEYHARLAKKLFFDAKARTLVLLVPGNFLQQLTGLLPEVYRAALLLDHFLKHLRDKFREAEARLGETDYVIKFDVANGLHAQLRLILVGISSLLKEGDLTITTGEGNLPQARSLPGPQAPETAADQTDVQATENVGGTPESPSEPKAKKSRYTTPSSPTPGPSKPRTAARRS